MSHVPPDFWKFAWIAWLLAFALLEWLAVKSGEPNAHFSGFTWWILGSHDGDTREWYRWLARAVVLALIVFLIPHFFTKAPWPEFMTRWFK